LQSFAPNRLDQLNQSDRSNPRRLVRAIEQATGEMGSEADVAEDGTADDLSRASHHYLGLEDDWETIEQKIRQRIETRLDQGVLAEAERVLADENLDQRKALSLLGMRELASILEGETSRTEGVESWFRRERAYAKRQLTWWKKYAPGDWFKISEPETMSQAYEVGLARLLSSNSLA
jgi:tRNA dimethylallyltransferase